MTDEKLNDVLFYVGREWGRSPTAQEIVQALDIAGYVIVPKELPKSMEDAPYMDQEVWSKMLGQLGATA